MTSNQETTNIECSQLPHQMVLATKDKLKEAVEESMEMINNLETLHTQLAEVESRDRVHRLSTQLISKILVEKDEKVLMMVLNIMTENVSGEGYEAPNHFSTEPPILQSIEDRIKHRFGKNPDDYEKGKIGRKIAELFRRMNQGKDPEKRPQFGRPYKPFAYPVKYWELMDHPIASDLGLEADVKLSRGYLPHLQNLHKVDCVVKYLFPTISIRRNQFGNHAHPETGLIFDIKTKKVIGKQNDDGSIEELTAKDIAFCKCKYGDASISTT